MGGIEPPTSWIWIKCSPTELHRQLWFRKDLNPHSEIRSFMCYPLHHETNCCPPRIWTSILWTKTRCTAVIREDNLVGAVGLEPTNSKEAWFTVKCSCRCAMLPSWKVSRGVFRYFIDERYSRLLLPSLGALSGVCVLPALPSSVSWIGELPHSSTPCYHGHTLWFPLFVCTPERTRTSNTWFWRPVLYQLSYRRVFEVGVGIEPTLIVLQTIA